MTNAKPLGILGRLRGLFSEAISEAELMNSAKSDAISNALGELCKAKPGMPTAPYSYVVDFDDARVIFSADLDNDGDRDLYQVAYKLEDNGECTFTGTPQLVKRVTTYEPVTEQPGEAAKADAAPIVTEAETELAELTMLTEAAIKADGSSLIKIIQPGWGSSGFYSKTMLERDGPKVFKAGTKMFLDHPTKAEERDLPERSVTRLAGTITGDAKYLEGAKAPRGDGLYAPASIVKAHAPLLEDLAPHIGVSIRAMGRSSKAHQTIEGRSGPVIEELTAAKSVDFVTQAGAGGEIVSLFESARDGHAYVRTITESAPAAQPQKEAPVGEQKTIEARLTEVETENARLREAGIMRDARDFAVAEVARVRLPSMTRARILEAVVADPPVKDGALDKAALKTAIDEAAKAEAKYLESIGVGRIQGMGAAVTEADPEKQVAAAGSSLEASFKTMGLKESTAKAAAAGRAN